MTNTKNKNNILKKSVRVLIFIIFFLAVFLFSFSGMFSSKISYSEGDVAEENIIAPKRMINERLTEALRKQAENTTPPVYDYVSSAQQNAEEKINRFYNGVSSMYGEYIDEASVKNANTVYSLNLSVEDYEYLVGLTESERNVLRNTSLSIMGEIYSSNEVISSQLDSYRKLASDLVDSSALNDLQKKILKEVIASYICPNMMLNESATQLAKQAARDSVYEVVYETGQTIIKKGDVITADDIQFLKDNNLMRTGLFDKSYSSFGLPALLLIVILLFCGFVKTYCPDIFKSTKDMLIIAAVCLVILAAGSLCMRFSLYMIPAALFSMTICMLYSSRIAEEFNFFFMLFMALTLELDVDAIIYLSISCYAGVVKLKQIRSRIDIIKSGVFVCIVNIITVVLIGLVRGSILNTVLRNTVYAAGSGLISVILTNTLIMVWENVFNKLTPFKLLEMSGANDEAIQNLITKAPGTYHHSLIVSNLAEAAAAKVGANPLLARVGAYYHDIGKAEKALYFSENQANTENILESLAPEASAKIIKNHVSDGLYLAEKNNIPKEISKFIDTHHGTSEITYFKVKAQQQNYKGDEDFHYHGELPSSKETSIVMLADSVEAAVRSLSVQSPENIKNIIDKLVHKKISEGQLLHSSLTFADIETIKKEFFEIMCSVYHARVKYPGQEEKTKEVD